MNKTKMILAVTGGAIGLVVLGMALLVWFAFAERTVAIEGDDEEGIEGLETVLGNAQTLSGKKVYPCAENVAAINGNRTQVTNWQATAKALAARGDRAYEKTTPAAFKAFIASDARRLSGKPGAVEGRLTKTTFDFGPFRDYISGGKLPAEGELAGLQRKWDDVATVTEILADSGIAELTDVQFKEKKDFTYVFTFTTRPAAFVKAINALEVGERFTVVDDFTLTRPDDTVSTVLGAAGDGKKADAKQSSGRRRRRGEAASASTQKDGEESAPKNIVVTDPSAEGAPLTAVLTVTVHDFGSLTGEVASAPLQKGKK